jgi:Fe-S-cluster containining protein
MRLQIIDKNEGFSCNGCSNCCQQPYSIAIEKEKAHALSDVDFSQYEQLAGKKFYQESKDAPDGFYVIPKQEGSTKCLFLLPDGLCIIHKELGAEAKPTPCQRFPFHESVTFVDHRVSVNFGCPSVISDKETRLVEQEAEIAAGSKVPDLPPDHKAFVGLNHETGVSHGEFDALANSLETFFQPERPTSIWQAFHAGLSLVQQTIEKKKGGDEDLSDWLNDRDAVALLEEAATVTPVDNLRSVASPVRMRFAATLMRDALPQEVTLNMSLWRRIFSLPKVMPLAKMSGTYFSKVQQREIDIDQVAKHPLPDGIDAQATELLKRCFRTRIWQRFLIGTRLSVLAGLHQHIHDLNCILFLSRVDAFYNGESKLSYDVVAKNVSRFEFNFANQPRLFSNNSASWFNNQLNDLSLAFASLEMMAMGVSSPEEADVTTAITFPIVSGDSQSAPNALN